MHIRYDEEQEETAEQELARRMQQPVAAQNTAAHAPCAALNVVNIVKTDFDGRDQCYVFDLAASTDSSTVAASLSNHTIKLYTARDGLQYIGDLTGHTDTITAVKFADQSNSTGLHSSSEDGTIRSWDCRSGKQAQQFSAGTGKVWSFSTSSNYLAAGTNDQVLFWDARTGKQCGAFADTHAEDVTQVMFHGNRFLSGSVDGLINVFDLSSGFDEDEGFLAALNIDTSVSRFGLYGPNSEKLWCLSHTETLHLWEWLAACDEESEGGQGMLGEDRNTRASITQAASTTPGADPLGPALDYLVTCAYSQSSNQLLLLAGNNQGAVGCFPVAEPSAPGGPCSFGGPRALLSGAHDSVVRSVLWSDSGALVTGGEDARLVQWSAQPSASGQHQQLVQKPSSRSSGSVMRKDAVRRRQSPY